MLTLLKALADPIRLRLLAVLVHGEQTVQDLTAILGLGQSRVSHHLKALVEAGVLSVKPQGTWKYYRLEPDGEFLLAIWPALAARLPTVAGHAADLAALGRVLDERQRKSRAFFDRHARQWDELAGRLLPLPDYRAALLAQVPANGVLLEIGSGTGALLVELSQRVTRLIAVDHSPAMLELARERVAAEGLGNVELRLGDMAHLPLGDALADAVLLNMVLHHAAAPATVLREIARVLAPGGRLLLADLARHQREVARDELADQWLGFESEELAGWLQAAGFADIVCERLTGKPGEESVLLIRAHKAS